MVTKASESSDHSRILLDVIVRERKKFKKWKNPLILLAVQFLGKTQKGEQENRE